MCLAVPGKVIEIQGDDPLLRTARVSFAGVIKNVSLTCAPEAKLGDYVLVHVGFAIRRIPEEEIESTLAFFEDMASEDLEGLSPRKPAPNPEGA